MITVPEKFANEARLARSKPTAVIGFVKAPLSAEASFASHWNAAIASSNVAVVGNELHLAKTLATTGVSQTSATSNFSLPMQFEFRSLRGGGGSYVWSDDVRVILQSFTVPVKGYLDKIKVRLAKVLGTDRSTLYIALSDSNEAPLEEPISFSSSLVSNPGTWIEADFSARNRRLDPGTYKVFVTQSAVAQEGSADILSAFVGSPDPYAGGSFRYGNNVVPSTFDLANSDLTFEVTMLPRYQSTGSISIKLDLGLTPADPGEWVLEDIRDDGSSISYQAWSSATGAFAGEETNLGTIVDGQTISNLKRYYKVTATLTASADNLTTPKVLKIKGNFDIWDRYCLKDSALVYKDTPLPPIVVSVPQIQYQIDILEGKASISKVSVDFLDDGFLEEAIVNYYLRNNEIVIYIGFDADGWGFEDYIQFWRGNIVDWKRRPGIITLECADWAVLSKKDIPVEDSTTGAIIPLAYDAHPMDIEKDILQNKINMRDSQIHFQSIDDAKASANLTGWRFLRTISKPSDAWKFLQEINQNCGVVLIPREDGKLYAYLFDTATAHVAEFGDNEVKLRSASFDARMEQTLINQAIVYYGFHIPLSLTGSATWTNNSPTVNGSGTLFLKELGVGMEIQGPDSRLYVVKSIASDTQFVMETVYAGSTTSGAIKRPRTDDEGKPSSYQGAVVVTDATSIANYKETRIKRILPSLWLGPDDGTYAGKTRATNIGNRIINWAKDGIAFAMVTTSLEFLHLQVGDFIRLGSRTTLPRNLLGYTWTKWVLVSKSIDFKGGEIRWSMMKVPSGVGFSDELRAYSEWLEAATNLNNLVIRQWPTEVILQFTSTAKTDKLDTLSEWNAYEAATNILIEA